MNTVKNRQKNKTVNGKFNNTKRSTYSIRKSIDHYMRYSLGKNFVDAADEEILKAVALTVREDMIDRMLETERRYKSHKTKRLYYLSMEFLIGQSLSNNLHNLGIYDLYKETLAAIGVDIEQLQERERDAALGNGGLGRLAACFLDSLATLNMPGFGYGINYEFGMFKQNISNGHQKELPDRWLSEDSPWQIEQASESCLIPVYGYIENILDQNGNYNPMWLGWQLLIGVPRDMPIVGYGGKTVNYLRLYSAKSSDQFDVKIFNTGDYIKAVEQKIFSEKVSKVLYPSDSIKSGKELRLIQEYFLVACSLRDIIRRHQKDFGSIDTLPEKVAIQLNDTHPALAVAELMRILVDEHTLDWDHAWKIAQSIFGYTNHTLLPEALEKWPVPLMELVLPRHMQIIYEINHRFLKKVSEVWPDDADIRRRMSIIQEGKPKKIRMAYLSIIGSHSTNGVAALHSELIKSNLVPDFYKLWPEKFNNKTNGITQRRWLLKSNPLLSNLITEKIGDGWVTDLSQLKGLERLAGDREFQNQFLNIKRANKVRLTKIIEKLVAVRVNPDTLFDIQIKRIHEYKRQLLNVMHIIHLYLSIIEDQQSLLSPRTYIFAGKAAPGYWAAKQIIKLINNVAGVINNDIRVKDQLKVVFLPDYRVSLAEKIFPAADISEQISTAGMEASGTGNMKFALNGALTIGSLDGANIEILEEVGKDNIYIFGLKADEIHKMEQLQSYKPFEYYTNSPTIKRVMDALNSNLFCDREPGLFQWIFQKVVYDGDKYFHLADLESYLETQERVSLEFQQPDIWAEKAILNVARIGKFSSDRTIQEYAKDIWDIKACLG